jgi:hypothetical protein
MLAMLVAGCTACTPKPNPAAQAATKEGIAPTPKEAPAREMTMAWALEIPNEKGDPITVQDSFHFHSGEHLRLQWRADFAAYLYLFNRGPKANSYQRLYPSSSEASFVGASPDNPVRIPKGADSFRLDTDPGDEQLILVASPKPIRNFDEHAEKWTVEAFDRELISLERTRRARSMRLFEDGNWHKVIAASPREDVAIISRVPLYHE